MNELKTNFPNLDAAVTKSLVTQIGHLLNPQNSLRLLNSERGEFHICILDNEWVWGFSKASSESDSVGKIPMAMLRKRLDDLLFSGYVVSDTKLVTRNVRLKIHPSGLISCSIDGLNFNREAHSDVEDPGIEIFCFQVPFAFGDHHLFGVQ